jgi:hypothetical protein
MNLNFRVVLLVYAILGLLAAVTLDGEFRIGILILLGGITLKSWLVELRKKLD